LGYFKIKIKIEQLTMAIRKAGLLNQLEQLTEELKEEKIEELKGLRNLYDMTLNISKSIKTTEDSLFKNIGGKSEFELTLATLLTSIINEINPLQEEVAFQRLSISPVYSTALGKDNKKHTGVYKIRKNEKEVGYLTHNDLVIALNSPRISYI
jgi:hypothetical protein